MQAGELLLASGKYEEGSMAIRFVRDLSDQVDEKTLGALAGYFRAGICNWAHTDVLCGEVLAPALASGRVRLTALDSWRGSELKYQRRAVPVAMLGLLKTAAPVATLLDFLRPLMLDQERVVQQGLGWFLREAWKKYPKPVEAFLEEWRDLSPRLIFQYATEKMTPAGRDRFRRGGKGAAKGKAAARGLEA
jgi:3-methyladenine DNA glycosylase AlkD